MNEWSCIHWLFTYKTGIRVATSHNSSGEKGPILLVFHSESVLPSVYASLLSIFPSVPLSSLRRFPRSKWFLFNSLSSLSFKMMSRTQTAIQGESLLSSAPSLLYLSSIFHQSPSSLHMPTICFFRLNHGPFCNSPRPFNSALLPAARWIHLSLSTLFPFFPFSHLPPDTLLF